MPQTTREEPFPDGLSARTSARATLDKRGYTSTATMVSEWEGIWTQCWLFAGLESDLKQLARFVYSGHSRIMGSMKNVAKRVGEIFDNPFGFSFYDFSLVQGDRF